MSRIAAALVALALLTAGCSGGSEPPAPSAPSAASTPLDQVTTEGLAVARADFCSRVAPAAVEEALGGAPAGSDTYANGDRVHLARGVTDVAHEYGCRWRAGDGTTLRAWVFAPPITPGDAGRLGDAAAAAKGCDPVPDAPRFGSRSVAVRCSSDEGLVTAFHGLFGDAWLSCSLAVPAARDRAELLDRTGRWCATVVLGASE